MKLQKLSILLVLLLLVTGCCKNQKPPVTPNKASDKNKTAASFLSKVNTEDDFNDHLAEYKAKSSKLTDKQKDEIIEKASQIIKKDLNVLFEYYNYSLTLHNEKRISEYILQRIKGQNDITIVNGCVVLGKICNHYSELKPEILKMIKAINIDALSPVEKKKIRSITSELIKNEDKDSDYCEFHLELSQKFNDAAMLIDQAIINERSNNEYSKRIYLRIVTGNFDNEEKAIAAFNLAQTYWEDTSENNLSRSKSKEYYLKTLELDPEFILKEEVQNKIRIIDGLKPIDQDDDEWEDEEWNDEDEDEDEEDTWDEE